MKNEITMRGRKRFIANPDIQAGSLVFPVCKSKELLIGPIYHINTPGVGFTLQLDREATGKRIKVFYTIINP